jgi:hypothetical protein
MNRLLVMHAPKRKVAIWLLLGLGLLGLVAANGHLVYVAMTSQPECVAHVRSGESAGPNSQFSAAKSSCTPGMRDALAETKRARQ